MPVPIQDKGSSFHLFRVLIVFNFVSLFRIYLVELALDFGILLYNYISSALGILQRFEKKIIYEKTFFYY